MDEELKCPHCGEVQDDGSIEEHNIEMAPHVCTNCETEFWFSKNVQITYCAWMES